MSSPKERLLKRVAADITPGMAVNLGIGLPASVINYLPARASIALHTENGLVGIGPTLPLRESNRNLIDSGGSYVSTVPGSVFLDSADSFAIVRSGRLDLTLLGAFEVSSNGDLANWKIPGKFSPGVGGAIELAQKSRRVGVVMSHTDRAGNPKIVSECSMPLTASKCVNRIYTDLAVLDITETGLTLVELARETTIEHLRSSTDAHIGIPNSGIQRF